jgi:hypothetical protein
MVKSGGDQLATREEDVRYVDAEVSCIEIKD